MHASAACLTPSPLLVMTTHGHITHALSVITSVLTIIPAVMAAGAEVSVIAAGHMISWCSFYD